MAMPVLRAIRRAHPRRRPGRSGSAGNRVALPRGRERRHGVRAFGPPRRRPAAGVGGFAEAWLLPNSFRSALAPWLAGIPERIGYDTDHRGPLLTLALRPASRTEHQLRDYDALLRSRGIEPDLEAPRLPVTAKALDRAVSSLDAAGIDRDEPLALFAPGAAFGQTKRWPPERYGALGALLKGRGLACAVVIGPGEEALGAATASAAGARLPVLGADLDPVELAALISCARVDRGQRFGPDAPGRRGRRSRRRVLRADGSGTHRPDRLPFQDPRPLRLLLPLFPEEVPLRARVHEGDHRRRWH